MVEELARWKSVLTKRINNMQENLNCLIEERTRVRNCLIKSTHNLAQTNEKYCNSMEYVPKASNIIDLALDNVKLSHNISKILLNDCITNNIEYIVKLPSNTLAETIAMQVSNVDVFDFSSDVLVYN